MIELETTGRIARSDFAIAIPAADDPEIARPHIAWPDDRRGYRRPDEGLNMGRLEQRRPSPGLVWRGIIESDRRGTGYRISAGRSRLSEPSLHASQCPEKQEIVKKYVRNVS